MTPPNQYPQLQDALLASPEMLTRWIAALSEGRVLPFQDDSLLVTISSSLSFYTSVFDHREQPALILVGIEDHGFMVLPSLTQSSREGAPINKFQFISAGCPDTLSELLTSFFDVLAAHAKKVYSQAAPSEQSKLLTE